MEQLEVRAYERQEIAEIMGLKVGSHNFLRDVCNKLEKWGYDCETPRGGAIIITNKPETAKERLAEIMIRLFGLDIQIDTLDFACYMDFMLNEPHAQTMPWKLRHEKIMEQYGMDIAEITLRRWTNRLIEHGVVFKSPFAQDARWWMTTITLGEKDQEPVPDEMRHLIPEYFRRRQELYKEALEAECGNAKAAWRETYRQLWIEYGCCFYRCKYLEINGISTEEIDYIITLVTEIIEAPDDN